MLNSMRSAVTRLQRNLAQHGIGGAFKAVSQRVRSGRFTLAPLQQQMVEGVHPFDNTVAGLDTAGLIRGPLLTSGHPHDVYNTAYYGTAPSLFRNVLECWLGTPNTLALQTYTFLDIGSGKGRVILLAAEYPFSRCVGIELNHSLHEIACCNIDHWRAAGKSVSPMQSFCVDATTYVFPTTPCLVYLFNPFSAVVLKRLLDAIAVAFQHRSCQLDLLYVNDEHAALLRNHPGFQLLWEHPISMSTEDASADLLFLADSTGHKPYGVEGQESCSAWRWLGANRDEIKRFH